MHLSDSLSNLPEAVERLVAALDALGGLENLQVSDSVGDEILAQSGAVDPAAVRLQLKENRKLPPGEVVYQAGASQRELTRQFWFTNIEPILRNAKEIIDLLNPTVEQVNVAVKAITDGRLDVAERTLGQAGSVTTDTEFEDIQGRVKTQCH